MYNTIFVEATFAAITLFSKNVTFEGFLMRDLAGAGYFESFFGTGVCFNLWHVKLPFAVIPCWRSRTDGKLFGPCGQCLFYGLSPIKRKMVRKGNYILLNMRRIAILYY
jgi:hypothetical protein